MLLSLSTRNIWVGIFLSSDDYKMVKPKLLLIEQCGHLLGSIPLDSLNSFSNTWTWKNLEHKHVGPCWQAWSFSRENSTLQRPVLDWEIHALFFPVAHSWICTLKCRDQAPYSLAQIKPDRWATAYLCFMNRPKRCIRHRIYGTWGAGQLIKPTQRAMIILLIEWIIPICLTHDNFIFNWTRS